MSNQDIPLSIPLHFAPATFYALRLGACTAMMCSEPLVKKMLDAQCVILAARLPKVVLDSSDEGEAFVKIHEAMRTQPWFAAFAKKEFLWRNELDMKSIIVTVGESTWMFRRQDSRSEWNEANLEDFRAWLRLMAPLDAREMEPSVQMADEG